MLAFLDGFAAEAPDQLGITVTLRKAPPLPFLPPEHVGRPVLGLVLVWAGDLADGERATAPLRRVGSPIVDVVRPLPYAFIQSMLDGGAPPGRHYYWRSHRLDGLPDAVIDVFLERLCAMTSPFAQINGWAMGGAVARVDPDATAVGPREVGFDISLPTAWMPADPDPERHKQWARAGWDALREYSCGLYANFISDEGDAGVDAAYGARRARLSALKSTWDPHNVFRMNANIAPREAIAR